MCKANYIDILKEIQTIFNVKGSHSSPESFQSYEESGIDSICEVTEVERSSECTLSTHNNWDF